MKKKKIITTPFDTAKIPPRQNVFLLPFIWLACWFITKKSGLTIHKERMEGLKPPYLVLGTHHAFMDFYVTPLALYPHRANYVSELEGFQAFGEWIYRQAGCLGTRKFVYELDLIKNIKNVIKRKDILVLYPEARYANVGTNSNLPDSIGKLAKMLQVPVVVLNMKGNYLQAPIWNTTVRKGVKLEANMTQVFTREELEVATAKQVQEKLQDYMTYDEYAWQYEKKMKIGYSKRAEGLELVLYKCPKCMTEFRMATQNADLMCEHCNTKWKMTTFGRLERVESEKMVGLDMERDFSHIPDWYEWQRVQVEEEIKVGNYKLQVKVEVDALPNAINFIGLGEGLLEHSSKGFILTFTNYQEKEKFQLKIPSISMSSIHTEYDFRGKGQCITLSTLHNTYFLFPKEKGFNATKIQFATECLYEKSRSEIKSIKRISIKEEP